MGKSVLDKRKTAVRGLSKKSGRTAYKVLHLRIKGVFGFDFLAAIPSDDAELREYDRSVPKRIAKIRKSKRIADNPRR